MEDIETHLQPVSLNENLSQLSTKKINRSSDQLGGTGMNKIQLATDGSSKPIEKISLKSNNRFLSSKISNNNLVEIQTPLSVDSTPSSNENLAIPLVAPIVNNRFLNSHQSNSKKNSQKELTFLNKFGK